MDSNLIQYFNQKDVYEKSLNVFMERKAAYEEASVLVEEKKAILDRVTEVARQAVQARVSKLNADLRGASGLMVKLDGLSPIVIEQKRGDAGIEEIAVWRFKVDSGAFCLDSDACVYSKTPGVMEMLFRVYPNMLAQLNA